MGFGPSEANKTIRGEKKNCFFFVSNPYNPTWGPNPEPQDQESHPPPAEPARCPKSSDFCPLDCPRGKLVPPKFPSSWQGVPKGCFMCVHKPVCHRAAYPRVFVSGFGSHWLTAPPPGPLEGAQAAMLPGVREGGLPVWGKHCQCAPKLQGAVQASQSHL